MSSFSVSMISFDVEMASADSESPAANMAARDELDDVLLYVVDELPILTTVRSLLLRCDDEINMGDL
mgnify:CR=1 FL=1